MTMSLHAVLGTVIIATISATDPAVMLDVEGPPAVGLIQWGDRLRRQFQNSPEEEAQQQEEPKATNAENMFVDLANEPAAMVQHAKLNLHLDAGKKTLPSADTHIFAKAEMDHARSPHRNPAGHGQTQLAREVQITENGRLPSQHMTLAQRRKHDSNAINTLLEAAKGANSKPPALLQEGHAKRNQGSQVAEMPEDMVGQEENLALPEEDTAKVQDANADQGVAMLQHADQIVQTGELFEEEVPLSQFQQEEPCSAESCKPEARQWWELLGNY
jgi:hypothetical protein